MEPSQDFKSLQDEIQASLISTVKTVNRIAAEDLGFQRTVNPNAADHLDDKISRLLHLSARLLQSSSRACGTQAPKLEDAEDIDMNWSFVVDVVDSVLEKADTALDEYTGLVKRKDSTTTSDSLKSKKPKSTAKVIRNANVKKPQIAFEVQPDNSPSGPWKPILTEKPHATVSLEKSLVTFTNDAGAAQYKHPYEAEISAMEYPDRVSQPSEPIPSQPAETTAAIWVDTYEGVVEMLKELKKAKEIAVDLEHHDFRTYVGLVSLMQISTREKDWIIDTLRPWRQKLEILNQVFAYPSIIKVFHGAYMDMVWLQRDLGLYINGLFDTYFACEALAYPGRSLAFLLSKFVNFDADKQYQLADWRIRPVPDEMMYYARSDTHYLLYVYDCLRNELVKLSDRSDPDGDRMARVLQKSRELALSRYEHPECDAETGQGSRGWYGYVLKNSHIALNSEQFAVFRALWQWRDDTARKEDESPNFVLGTSSVTEISRINPPDAKALHSLLPSTSPMARSRINEIWKYIQRTKARGGPSLLQFFQEQAPGSLQPRNGLARISKTQPTVPTPASEVSGDRLPRSQLFGNVAISSQWDAVKRPSAAAQDSHFPFPWQRYVQDGVPAAVSAETESPKPAEGPAKSEPPQAASPLESEPQDEEFTLRRGRKRKSEALESRGDGSDESDVDMQDTQQDENEEEDAGDKGMIAVDDGDDKSEKRRKRELKREKKAEKARRKEEAAKRKEAKLARKAQKTAAAEEKKNYQAVPFDYSKAASVLHVKRDDAVVPVMEKKVFDPYSKSGDGDLKGARKMPPVKGEKSATFRK